MRLEGKVVVVTGGASGIGEALCVRFAREGAEAVVVADRREEQAATVARAIGGTSASVDVSVESQVQALVSATVERFGRIDLFCSNAGILVEGGPEAPDEDWERVFRVNVMAHVYAARAVLPGMLARGEGYLLQTASAAGLLSQPGAAPYAVSKHAAVAFAEWLAFTYGDRGIKVSCLCPQGVVTGMLNADEGPAFLLAEALSPEAVAESVVEGLSSERFLILPHGVVRTYMERKASDYDRWLAGMRRLDRATKEQKS